MPHLRGRPPGRTDASGPSSRSDGASPMSISRDVAADGPLAIDKRVVVDLAALALWRGTTSAIMAEDPVLWRSLTRGADVRGNATAVAPEPTSSCRVSASGLASGGSLGRYRLVVSAITIVASVAGLWLCYCAFAG
jgi:hypothetical protein